MSNTEKKFIGKSEKDKLFQRFVQGNISLLNYEQTLEKIDLIGKRVKCIIENIEVNKGEQGTIVKIKNAFLGIRFDEYSKWRHNLQGDCEKGHGYYLTPNEVEIIDE